MNKKIVSFLKSHDLISINALEEKLNIPQSTIWKAVKGDRDIPEKHLKSVIAELKKYGFKNS